MIPIIITSGGLRWILDYSDKGNYLKEINHDTFWLFNIDSSGQMTIYLLNMVISP